MVHGFHQRDLLETIRNRSGEFQVDCTGDCFIIIIHSGITSHNIVGNITTRYPYIDISMNSYIFICNTTCFNGSNGTAGLFKQYITLNGFFYLFCVSTFRTYAQNIYLSTIYNGSCSINFPILIFNFWTVIKLRSANIATTLWCVSQRGHISKIALGDSGRP